MKIASSIMFGLLMASGNVSAGPEDVDPGCPTHRKSEFNLFHPTPESLLRDLDTDRPDRSTSPHTVDAGHFQIESDFVRYAYSHRADTRTEGWAWGSTDLRIGITNWADLQLFIPSYLSTRETDPKTHQTHTDSGIGDLTVILKTNFWGNESDDFSGGAAFFVKTPTASHGVGNGKVEGGVLFLIEKKTFLDFDITFNTGVAIDANDDGGGYHADLLNIVNLSHDIAGPVSAYVEFFSSIPTRHSSEWVGTIDLGLMVKLGKNFQLDAGLNIGVTHAAQDLEPFLGFSYRF